MDDNSPDGTGALADDLARRLPDHGRCIGPASSVSAPPWSPASSAAQAPVVGVIDADLSHPPDTAATHAGGHAPDLTRTWSSAAATSPAAARELAAGPADHVAPRVPPGARPLTPVRDATSGLLPHPPRSGARRAHLGRRLQDLPRAARARPAGVGGGGAVRVRRTATAGESKMNTQEALGYLTQLRHLRRFQRSRSPPPQTYRRFSAEELRIAGLGASRGLAVTPGRRRAAAARPRPRRRRSCATAPATRSPASSSPARSTSPAWRARYAGRRKKRRLARLMALHHDPLVETVAAQQVVPVLHLRPVLARRAGPRARTSRRARCPDRAPPDRSSRNPDPARSRTRSSGPSSAASRPDSRR